MPRHPDNGHYEPSPTGTGKTHLAVALGREAIRQNYNVQFITAATLVATLAKAHADGSLDKQLATLSRPKLLIIDELGYLPLEANAAHLFFQLVSQRYEKGSILITSNRSVGEWGSVAILDRLVHNAHRLQKACENIKPAPTLLTQPHTPESINRSVEAAAHDRVKSLLTIK